MGLDVAWTEKKNIFFLYILFSDTNYNTFFFFLQFKQD